MMAAYVQPLLLITGLATASAVVLVVAPATMMKLVFGQAPADPLGLKIARHWALLISLVGALIVYAAYRPQIRVSTLVVAVVEKAAFAVCMLTSPLRRRPAVMVLALADAAMAAPYVMILAGL